LLPESRGQITLRSADPADKPVIEANYFSAEKDMRLMVEGVKLARKMGESEVFKPFNGGESLPGADVQTDEQIAEFISQYAETLYHPVGTCKMGVDEMAVVNPELKVHGIEGLRVADASIMPIITNGNTNAPSIMIGAKCAEMILG
jgi:choline dehydrogenase